MSERGRVVLIFGVVALIAGGAGFYFFGIYQPAQQLAEARAEIATWEERYQQARDCLLGKTPGSTKTSEALAIREMAPDPWDRGKCTPIVSKLSRGLTTDTGIDRVEAAWTELDKAAQTAAIAFARHVGSSTTLEEDPLPKALDDLDAARGKLRAAAELPAATQTGTPLSPAQIIPLADGAEPVTELDVDTLPSAHGFLTFGKTASREVQIAIPTGGTPNVVRVGPGSMRAVPDASWGATSGPLTLRFTGSTRESVGEIQAGAMNAEGVVQTPTKLPIVGALPARTGSFVDDPTLKPGTEIGAVTLAAAGGTLADGAVVYAAYRTMMVARAKANVLAPGAPIAIDTATVATDLDGRIAITWSAGSTHKALLVRPGGEDAYELPAAPDDAPCMTQDRIWVLGAGHEAFSFGGGRPLARVQLAAGTGLQGCTADVAIVRRRDDPREVELCTDQCRKVRLPSGAPSLSAVTAVAGKLRAISSHAGVLGVWSEDKSPVFYALPMHARPVLAHEWPAMAMSNGKVIDIIARGAKTFVVIRIPAP